MNAMSVATPRRSGFTLIELLLSITLMAVITAATYFSFDAGTRAWRAGQEASDSLHHADFVLEQLAMGLRSACYPDAANPSGAYGMVLEDGGEGATARDILSWVKLGTALVGVDSPLAGTPHRIEVTVAEPGQGDGVSEPSDGGLAVRAWRIIALPDDLDPRDRAKSMVLTPRVVGLNFRMLDPENNLAEGAAPDAEDELEWSDAWEDDYTNRIPFAVEVSLYLAPPSEDDEPVEVKRIVEIPIAPLSWRDKGAAGGRAETGAAAGRDSRRGGSGRGGVGRGGTGRGRDGTGGGGDPNAGTARNPVPRTP